MAAGNDDDFPAIKARTNLDLIAFRPEANSWTLEEAMVISEYIQQSLFSTCLVHISQFLDVQTSVPLMDIVYGGNP